MLKFDSGSFTFVLYSPNHMGNMVPMQPNGGLKILGEQMQRAADDVFPPQTSRGAEIEALVELFRGVFAGRVALYVSAPITSGQRFVDWYARHHNLASLGEEQFRREQRDEVVAPNRSAASALIRKVRGIQSGPVIDPTAVGDIEGWVQGDYRTAWARIIEEFVRTVVFADGWEFSNGCCYEFLIATKAGIETQDESWRPITLASGVALMRHAVVEMSSRGLSVEFLRGILEELESLGDLPPSDIGVDYDRVKGTSKFKDAVLDSLSNHGNVAQFVSFSPSLDIRYSRIVGHSPNASFASLRDAIASLLGASAEKSVNIRSYHPEHPKSREFIYGLRNVEDAETAVRRLASEALYTIVNETVDVNDGGVSGVALGDVIEFAPGDTPRCVEKPGTLSLPRTIALSMLQRVYGFAPTLPTGRWRIEFSIHPIPRGYRQGHSILWEAERETAMQRAPRVRWPNQFSRFLGDKAFGLLLADCFGFPVPSTVVISRNVAPFAFGRSTGTGETWVRTCPREPVPGKFATLRGWTDPFKLLIQEDPAGKELVSVLSQEGVRAAFSGASISNEKHEAIVEGVEGIGSDFMLGQKAAQLLPPKTITAVKQLLDNLVRVVGGTLKIEWACDEDFIWILQMQQLEHPVRDAVVVPGEATRFRRFDVGDGIEQFREFAAEAKAAGDGIVLIGSVGVTSHFGDILRRSGVPSHIEPHS
ncbi:MAG: hypothetical protein ABSG32_14525 [Terriglobia bacterium]